MAWWSWLWWRRCIRRTAVGWDAVGNRSGNGVSGNDSGRALLPPRPASVSVAVRGHVVLHATFTGTPPSSLPLQLQQKLYGCVDHAQTAAVTAAVDATAGRLGFDYAYSFAVAQAEIDKFLKPALDVGVTDLVSDPAGGALQLQDIEDVGSIEVTYTF